MIRVVPKMSAPRSRTPRHPVRNAWYAMLAGQLCPAITESVFQLLRRPRSSAWRRAIRKVRRWQATRPFIDRYSMLIDAGQAVRDANLVRIISWRVSRRRPRVPGDVLGKHLAKM